MIENLELKLYGLIAINTNELFELVSSWGRKHDLTRETGEEIESCEPNQCYPLENLDVSQITDFRDIFCYSYYDGDLSKWNVSNTKSINNMFMYSEFNNDSLKNWLHTSKHSFGISFLDSKNSYNKQLLYFTKLASICKQIVFNFYFYLVSNVINMQLTFYRSKFNCNISNWDVSNVKNFYRIFNDSNFDGDISSWKINNLADCQEFFVHNKNFINKYLNNFDKNEIEIDDLFKKSKNFIKWFEENTNEIINNISLLLIIFFNYKYN